LLGTLVFKSRLTELTGQIDTRSNVSGNPAAQELTVWMYELAVVIEFESVEKAIAVHESEGYQKALKAIDGKVKRDFRIVEGV
jgi:uncharacterized protein (DUF1330 family)